MKQKTIITIAVLFTILVLAGISAKEYSLVCLNQGEVVEFSRCNPNIDDRTCDNDLCMYCTYVGTSGYLCPATSNPNPCNALGLSCSNGVFEVDQTPPEIIYLSLQDGEIYGDDRLDFFGNASEVSDWYYQIEIGGRWKKICSDEEICEKRISLEEGQNNISIKVVDMANNEAYQNISLFVDSGKPKIKKTLPKKRKFFDGTFWAQYKEYNVAELLLTYGNETDKRNASLENCPSGKKEECEINLDIAEFDGQSIEYWFNLTDIAGHVDESKHIEGYVDTTFPEVNNPDSFWSNEEGSKYVYFNLSITEDNFDEVVYTYIDSRGRLKDKRLCSRLKDGGICYKKKSFRRGEYNITVQISDEAGNTVGIPLNFEIDY